MKKTLLVSFLSAVIFFGLSVATNAWEYGTTTYSYQDSGQLNGTCPNNMCTGRVAKIFNNSNAEQTIRLTLHYGEKIGNYQWGEDHNGGIIWHEIPMSTNTWTQRIPSNKTVYYRVVLREQHPTSFQWLIYHVSSTPAVSHIFAKDGGGIYYMFPPSARFYNHNFEKDIYGYVMVVENSINNGGTSF